MNHDFKPGDLALLITVVESVPAGSVVELDRLIPKGECLEQADGQPFHTACACWSFSHPAIPEGYLGCVAEKFLMPLRGDFAPERQKAQEVTA